VAVKISDEAGSLYSPGGVVRGALHLEAGLICCVRGLKSSLVIGQKAQLRSNPFTTTGLIKKMTRPELVELGAPKREGQFLA
jgi:hypothetical protein